MRQGRKAGKAQARLRAARAVRGGDGGKFRVGSRKKQDVARRLAEIDRLAFLLDRAGLGREEMHQRPRFVGAVVLAEAGVQSGSIIAAAGKRWIPALAGMSWWLWQVRNGNGNIPTDLLDVVLAPFNFKVRDVLNVNDLGYDYAAGQIAIPVGG